jgi:hypothetical protein
MLSEYPCTAESIERNRIYNITERVNTACLMLDEATRDAIRILGLELRPIPEIYNSDVDGIEALKRILDVFGEERSTRWLAVLVAEKRRAEGR